MTKRATVDADMIYTGKCAHFSAVMEKQRQTSDMADISERRGMHRSTTDEQISTPSCRLMPTTSTATTANSAINIAVHGNVDII